MHCTFTLNGASVDLEAGLQVAGQAGLSIEGSEERRGTNASTRGNWRNVGLRRDNKTD